MQRTLIIMLKEPRPGQVKTRLGRDIGMVASAWWFRHHSLSLLRRIRDPRWRLVLAVAPDGAGLRSRIWPVDLARVPQGPGDLGQRMKRVMRSIKHGPVCLIGADIPGVGRPQIARAFAALGHHQSVFGPATDGGYWLIGLKHPRRAPRKLLRDVRWSSEHALADSVQSVLPMSVGWIDLLQDVDTVDDLARVYRPTRAASLLPMTAARHHARGK